MGIKADNRLLIKFSLTKQRHCRSNGRNWMPCILDTIVQFIRQTIHDKPKYISHIDWWIETYNLGKGDTHLTFLEIDFTLSKNIFRYAHLAQNYYISFLGFSTFSIHTGNIPAKFSGQMLSRFKPITQSGMPFARVKPVTNLDNHSNKVIIE